MNALREGLPPLPDRMKGLPVDERGYPVPYFVAWFEGKPDHRAFDGAKLAPALRDGRCWMCGHKLGTFKSFAIGPMCAITRTIAEPPSHRDCLRFAMVACPFLTRPRAKRRTANMPEESQPAPGIGLERNPGVSCIWTTHVFKPFRAGTGVLFELGEPINAEFYAEGRQATRVEVDASIDSGLHLLYDPARAEDAANPRAGAVPELEKRIAWLNRWLDDLAWPAAQEAA